MAQEKGGGNELYNFQNLDKNVESVEKIENDSFKPNPSKAKPGQATDLLQRPAYGTKGTSIDLRTNHWICSFIGNKSWHRCSVSVIGEKEGEIPKGRKLANIIKRLINHNLKPYVLASDYSSILISVQKLTPEEKVHEVTYIPEGATSGSKTYKVLVKYNKTMCADTLIKYLKDTNLDIPEHPDKQDIIQAMNIIVADTLRQSTNIVSDLREHFPVLGNNVESRSLGTGLNVFRGFIFSVRAATGRLLLNTQVKHLSAYRGTGTTRLGQQPNGYVRPGPGTLEVLLIELNNARVPLDDQEKFIKGLSVKLTHFTPNRPKRILGFAKKGDGPATEENPNAPEISGFAAKAHEVKFWLNDPAPAPGRYISVANYFLQKHNKTASRVTPVVNIGTRAEPKYMLASLCRIDDGEEYSHKLDPGHTSQMIDMAVRPPIDNAQSIEQKARSMIQTQAGSKISNFGCSIGHDLLKVVGRTLPRPDVRYLKTPARISDGSWNLRDCEFAAPSPRTIWSALRVKLPTDRAGDLVKLQRYVDAFQAELVKSGLHGGTPATKEVALNQENHVEQLRARFEQARDKGGVRLLLVIMPSSNIPLYNAIKIAGDILCGVHTICVVENKFCKGHTQYFANVAMKFNLKLGGTNHRLQQTDLGFIAEGKTMIVGYDVTHPAAGQENAPSIAGVVASIDKTCAQWPAVVDIQTGRQEMVNGLQDMFKTRLERWHAKNKGYPDEILVYRDGVSEGQYQLVLDEELPKIRAACKSLYTAKSAPKITFVVVGKRHNVRFYPTSQNKSYKGNPQCGTVIDRGVTETRVWDFYLQSHTALQGTARPAHYVVLLDEIFRARAARTNKGSAIGESAVNSLQLITHNLCYMYGRATKAVSICPPAYYADIVCERARRWLSRHYANPTTEPGQGQGLPAIRRDEYEVHPNLKHTMFYM